MSTKQFKRTSDQIKEIIEWQGPEGCFATDRITVDGCKVGYMYREGTDDSDFPDSGWRFFQGEEEDDYVNNGANLEIYRLNTICNYDPDIIPFLKAPYGTAYFRDENGVFQEEELTDEEE